MYPFFGLFPYFCLGNLFNVNYGSTTRDFNEITRARRKTRRAKTFKHLRGCKLRRTREKSYR